MNEFCLLCELFGDADIEPPLPLRWWRHLWTAPYMYDSMTPIPIAQNSIFRILSPTIDHFCIQCKLWLGKGKYEFIQNLNSIELIGFSQAKHVIQIILEMNLLKLLKFRLFVSDPTNLPTCPKLQQDAGVWLESPWNTHMTNMSQVYDLATSIRQCDSVTAIWFKNMSQVTAGWCMN